MKDWPCIDESIKEKAAFVLADVETLGFDETVDPVVELGLCVVDKFLRPLAAKSWLILPQEFDTIFSESSSEVREMHTKNGLADELSALPSAGYMIENVEHSDHGNWANYSAHYQALSAWRWLTQSLGLPDKKFPLTGSSAHFDRKFIAAQLPVLDDFFHYRNIDVSSIKELCKIWNPDIYAALSKDPKAQKENKTHRVQDCLAGTIFELTFYFDNFLFVEIEDTMEGQYEIPFDGTYQTEPSVTSGNTSPTLLPAAGSLVGLPLMASNPSSESA